MSKSPLDVVCDAGPLIHLDEMGCLDLLIDFHAVLVPEQVWRELVSTSSRPEIPQPAGVGQQRADAGVERRLGTGQQFLPGG